MIRQIEIQFWKFAKYLIVRGYGCNCETTDLEEFPELKDNPKARCGSCKAKEIVEWIDKHIELLRM